jgi:hypothetical protein
MPDGTWSKPEGQAQPGGPDWWQATDGLWYLPALVRLPAAIPTPRGWPPYAIVFGGLWLMLASFLTWVKIAAPGAGFFTSLRGTERAGGFWIVEQGDGWPTVFLGVLLVVAGALAFVSPTSAWTKISGVVGGVASLMWLVLVHVHADAQFDRAAALMAPSLGGKAARDIFNFSFGSGFWLSFLGAGAALGGAIVLRPPPR